MPDLETREEVYEFYDGALGMLADINEAFENARKRIFDIFLTDIRYEDENGDIQVSGGINPEDPDFCDEAHAATTVFRKGQNLIRRVNDPETAKSLMLWYAKVRGITRDEIVELGNDPNSDVSIETRFKLEEIKQHFADLINSENTDKLADFYFDVFTKYKKDSNLIMKTSNVEGFCKNWPYLVQWVGVTGALQQSLEDEDFNSTSDQHTLILFLNVKLEQAYNGHTQVRDFVACMQAVDNAYSSIREAAGNRKIYRNYLGKDESEKIVLREKFADAIRTFNFIVVITLNGEMFSSPVPYPSDQMGKASVVLSYADNLASGNNMRISEMKFLVGDNAYSALYDLTGSFDFPYEHEDKSQLCTLIDKQYVYGFIDQKKFDDIIMSDITITKRTAAKVKAQLPMTYQEIALFFSDENPDFTESVKKAVRLFFNADVSFRMEMVSPEMQYAIEQYCKQQHGIGAEEYVSGAHSIASYCRTAYTPLIRLIKSGKTTETVNVAFHNQFSKLFRHRFRSMAQSGVGTQKFADLEFTFNTILSENPNYPSGREEEYKRKLLSIAEKAEEYINYQKVKGRTERLSNRAQMEVIMAKRLKTFADETLRQIKRAEDTLHSVRKS